jgi:hypothetical protein
MRMALCGVALAVLACRRQHVAPEVELRRTVVRDLPSSLDSLVGVPRGRSWQCKATPAEVYCVAGPRDSLRIIFHSIFVDPDSVDGSAVLTAIGVSATHYGPFPDDAFEVLWTDKYRREGSHWHRTKRTGISIS